MEKKVGEGRKVKPRFQGKAAYFILMHIIHLFTIKLNFDTIPTTVDRWSIHQLFFCLRYNALFH